MRYTKIIPRKLAAIVIITVVILALAATCFLSRADKPGDTAKPSASSASKTKSKQPAVPVANPQASSPISQCHSQNLALSLEAFSGTAKPQYDRHLILTNTGTIACTTSGYPGVSLIDQQGAQLGNPATRHPFASESIESLTVAPGQSVYALITLPDGDPAARKDCSAPAASLRVYPPGETQALTVADGYDRSCPDGGFSVFPLSAAKRPTI